MENVLTIILGGGKGTRLFPLTENRAKPAVPFGAKYRLVDIPISNSINAGFKRMYVLTQFNSASLHVHLSTTYIFDSFTQGFVEILAAEQSFESAGWYEGTADAVRKNLHHFRTQKPDHYMILSGDQLYRMDLRDFFEKHVAMGADATIATTPVDRKSAEGFGVVTSDKDSWITNFLEKPSADLDISEMKIPPSIHPNKDMMDQGREYLGSMGIYCFKADVMEEALDNNFTDFGNEIIPELIKEKKVSSYIFTGFWEDIGTIKSFYETNLNLASIAPDFNFYDVRMPIYTRKRDLPASKFNYSSLSQTLAADGCIITNSSINNSIVGIRTLIESGANLDGVICMGADYYETSSQKSDNIKRGLPNVGIGRGSLIKNAIIDKNARIGEGCRIGIDNISREEGDHGSYYIRDGIIIIRKNEVIPSGSVI